MLLHPSQREGQESRKRLCIERIINSGASGEDTAGICRRPETKALLYNVLVRYRLTTKRLLHTYSMILQKSITGQKTPSTIINCNSPLTTQYNPYYNWCSLYVCAVYLNAYGLTGLRLYSPRVALLSVVPLSVKFMYVGY